MARRRLPPLFAAGAIALQIGGALAQGEVVSQSQQPLIRHQTTELWTDTRLIPMCWHVLQFPDAKSEAAAKKLVMQTIKDGWIDLINLNITWTDCPTSGDAKHVRVLLRSGDAYENGTTLKPGMATLTTAAERTPSNDPPGLLMGFPASWNSSDQHRWRFQSLILHEFGHVLGFGHEMNRVDGSEDVSCYNDDFPDAIPIGPPDPLSIMAWSYCDEALGHLSLEDIRGVRSVYGARPIQNMKPAMIGVIQTFLTM